MSAEVAIKVAIVGSMFIGVLFVVFAEVHWNGFVKGWNAHVDDEASAYVNESGVPDMPLDYMDGRRTRPHPRSHPICPERMDGRH